MFKLNLRFPGQYYDAEIALFYNYIRTFHSALGRYTQSDPIGLQGGMNSYAYVGGNPVSFIDPEGLAINTPDSIWVCSRPVNAWYGSVIPDHQYICCSGPNQDCYGHANNDLKKGDPIPKEPDASGTCTMKYVSTESKDKHCNQPKSPCDASTTGWNCRDWAQWDGKSQCP